jgi:hypothetical protein
MHKLESKPTYLKIEKLLLILNHLFSESTATKGLIPSESDNDENLFDLYFEGHDEDYDQQEDVIVVEDSDEITGNDS